MPLALRATVGCPWLSDLSLVHRSFATATATATAITRIASCSRRLGADAFPLVLRAAVILALSRLQIQLRRKDDVVLVQFGHLAFLEVKDLKFKSLLDSSQIELGLLKILLVDFLEHEWLQPSIVKD